MMPLIRFFILMTMTTSIFAGKHKKKHPKKELPKSSSSSAAAVVDTSAVILPTLPSVAAIIDMMSRTSLEARAEGVKTRANDGLYPDEELEIRIAAEKGDVAKLTSYLKENSGKGIDFNAPATHDRSLGFTALMYAASKGKTAAVTFLLKQKSVNFQSLDTLGRNAFMIACAQGRLDTARLIYDHAKTVLGDGIAEFINQCNFAGWTAFMLAASNDHLSVVDWLFSQGANVDIRSTAPDDEKRNAFLIAAEYGCFATVAFLCDKRPDLLECEDSRGMTALMLAAEGNYYTLVKVLMGRGADSRRISNEGRDAYEYATDKEICDLIADIEDASDSKSGDDSPTESSPAATGGVTSSGGYFEEVD